LEALLTAYHDNTTDQFNRFLGGKWIKISGKIKDNLGNGRLTFLHKYDTVRLKFGKGWDEQLSLLSRGADVTIRGKLANDNYAGIELSECELL
jgi:hypothetical protein